MREIKFRAWDGVKVRYDITGFEHGDKNEMAGVFIDGDYYKMTIDSSSHPYAEVMQFTGLKDKNGKEIYEGDILYGREEGNGETTAWTDVHVEVFYNTEYAQFQARDNGSSKDSCWSDPLDEYIDCDYEVIGNIHEGTK